jgi:hypothetical protein
MRVTGTQCSTPAGCSRASFVPGAHRADLWAARPAASLTREDLGVGFVV